MASLRTKACIVMIGVVPIVLHAQRVTQQSEKSLCSNIVALAGDAKINCSSLTPEQRKAIEQIPSILRAALTSQDYLKAIKAKLDEMSHGGTSMVVQSGGVGSIGQQGGITAGVVNFAPPVPRFLELEEVEKDGRGNAFVAKNSSGHPLTYARFYADSEWGNPAIVVRCDKPCEAASVNLYNPSITLSDSYNTFDFNESRSVTGFELTGILHPMLANTYYVVSVASRDLSPVRITAIAPYTGKLPLH